MLRNPHGRRAPEMYRTSHQRFRLLLCALVCCLGIQARQTRAGDAPRNGGDPGTKVWKVLMIGNSYTYFNNLPRMFEQMALSDKPARRVSCEMIAEGGATLQNHWEAGKAQKAIERGGLDFVVLQEQSTLGITYLVQGLPRITESPKYSTYARRFDAAIRKAGARTVLFAFWARENAPAEDHNALAYYHFRLGKDLGALIAPVGLAWQAVRKQDAHSTLYQDDHSHPRPEGSYLAACVLHAACFGAVPANPPLEISGKSVDVEGKLSPRAEDRLAKLSPEIARTFRDATTASLESSRQFTHELERHKPAPLRLPQLERGRRPTTEELQGDWTGQTKVYPRDSERPATMSLRLTYVADSWRAEAKITLGEKRPVIVPKITDLQITDDGISFVDSNKAPNGGSVARYRGAFLDGKLRGIAEINTKEGPLYVIGSWELSRQK